MAGNRNLNHCQQVDALEALFKGFLCARFDNIANLDPKLAKMTAEAFFKEVIKPRLKQLKDTGQRMEDGLFIRKTIMQLSNDCLEFTDKNGKTFYVKGKGNLEEYYQDQKPKLKKNLINKRLKHK